MRCSGSFAVTFAGNSIAVDWQGSSALAVLNFLYGADIAEGKGDSKEIFRLCIQEADGAIELYRADQLRYEGNDSGAAAGILLDETGHALAQDCADGPLFHAAALNYQGRGLLMPADSGSGKTTSAAWLTRQGFNYLSDELVFIATGATKLQAFNRPLHVKKPAIPVIEGITGIRFDPSHHEQVVRSRQGLLVQASLLNPTNTYTTPEFKLIIFPKYRPNADLKLTRLSKAEVGMRLIGCLVNARNLPQHGFPEIARLAQQAPAYAMTYGCIRQTDTLIKSLLH